MPLKSQIFTSSTSWPVPATVSAVWLMGIGAGAGGGMNPGFNSLNDGPDGSCGGGAGELTVRRLIPVSAGGTLAITIGASGVGGVASTVTNGTAGGSTIVGSYTMLGGSAAQDGTRTPGVASSTNGSYGGGATTLRGDSFFSGGAVPHITAGFAESPTSWGGAGGALTNNGTGDATDIGTGAFSNGWAIGQYRSTQGTAVHGHGGGGGGAPSMFGVGGVGGVAGVTQTNSGGGGNASATAYGAAGGGGCGTGTNTPSTFNTNGGAGGTGYVVLMWTEPT